MVTIINYKERQREDGTSFFVLEVQGGIEMIKSAKTGLYYASAKKATVSSTFDEATCNALIGTQMPGAIQKVPCDPYEYTVQESGEVITLSHRNTYQPNEESVSEQVSRQEFKPNVDAFSANGKYAVID